MSLKNTTVFAGKSGIIEATAELVIKDFVDVMAGFQPGRSIISDSFMLRDTPMRIRVYPNGRTDSDKGFVSLFLRNEGEDDISVKGQLVTDLKTMNFDYTETIGEGRGNGFGNFLKHADCADAYKDKDFVVTAKLEIPGDLVKVVGGQSAPGPKRQKLNVLENVYNKMSRPDFTLVFEGEEIPCHKIVLAAASPVFEAMVENKHREAIENRAATGWQNLAAHRAFVERVFANFCHKNDVNFVSKLLLSEISPNTF